MSENIAAEKKENESGKTVLRAVTFGGFNRADVLDFKNVTVKKGTTELVSVDDVYIRMLTKSLTIPESVSGT